MQNGALYEDAVRERIPEMPEGSLAKLDILQLAFGQQHGLILTRDGSVLAFGSNTFGQLGISSLRSSLSPVVVNKLQDYVTVQIAAGNEHSVALTDDGSVYTWGSNYSGQLGLSSATESANRMGSISEFGCRISPQYVHSLKNVTVTKVSCGSHHTVALTDQGDVYCWGEAKSGQVGTGRCSHVTVPQLTTGYSKTGFVINDIACGVAHTIALAETGGIFCWGLNNKGQLGGTDSERCLYYPSMLKKREDSESKGSSDSNSLIFGSQIGAGSYFSAVITLQLKLLCFGEVPASMLDTEDHVVLDKETFDHKIEHADESRSSIEGSVFSNLGKSPARSDSADNLGGNESPPSLSYKSFVETGRSEGRRDAAESRLQSRRLKNTLDRAEAASTAAYQVSVGTLKRYGPNSLLSGDLKKTAKWPDESHAQAVFDAYRERDGNPLRHSIEDRRYQFSSPALRPQHLLQKRNTPMSAFRRFSEESKIYGKLGGGRRRFTVDSFLTRYWEPDSTPENVFTHPKEFEYASCPLRETSKLYAGKDSLAVLHCAQLGDINPRTSSISGGTLALLTGKGFRSIQHLVMSRAIDELSADIPTVINFSKKELLSNDSLNTITINRGNFEPEMKLVRVPDTFARFSYLNSLEIDEDEDSRELEEVEDRYAAVFAFASDLGAPIDLQQGEEQGLFCFIPAGTRASEVGVQLFVRGISTSSMNSKDVDTRKKVDFKDLNFHECVLSADRVRHGELDPVAGKTYHSYFITPEFTSIDPARCVIPPDSVTCHIGGESVFAVMLSDPKARPYAVALLEYVEHKREEREEKEAEIIEQGGDIPAVERLFATSDDDEVQQKVDVDRIEGHLVTVCFRLLKYETEIYKSEIVPGRFVGRYDEVEEDESKHEEEVENLEEPMLPDGKFTAYVKAPLPDITLGKEHLEKPPSVRPIPVSVALNEPEEPSEPRPEQERETESPEDVAAKTSGKSSRKSSSRSKSPSKGDKKSPAESDKDEVLKKQWAVFDECKKLYEDLKRKQEEYASKCSQIDQEETAADKDPNFAIEALVSPCGPQAFPCSQKIIAQPTLIDRIEPNFSHIQGGRDIFVRGVGFSADPVVKLTSSEFQDDSKEIYLDARMLNRHTLAVSLIDFTEYFCLSRTENEPPTDDAIENNNEEEEQSTSDNNGQGSKQENEEPELNAEENTEAVEDKETHLSQSLLCAQLHVSFDGGQTFVNQFSDKSSNEIKLYSGHFTRSSRCFIDPEKGGTVLLHPSSPTEWFDEHIQSSKLRVSLENDGGSTVLSNWDQISADFDQGELKIFMPPIDVLKWLTESADLERDTAAIFTMDVSINGFDFVPSESASRPICLYWGANQNVTLGNIGPKKLALGGEITVETKGWETFPTSLGNFSFDELIRSFSFLGSLSSENGVQCSVQLSISEDSLNSLSKDPSAVKSVTLVGVLPDDKDNCPTGTAELNLSLDNGASWLNSTSQAKIQPPSKKK